jgi:hypothetical protein
MLCLSCHRDKCSSEHEQGQYIKPKETTSFFNSEVREIMNSDIAQQHAFVEKEPIQLIFRNSLSWTVEPSSTNQPTNSWTQLHSDKCMRMKISNKNQMEEINHNAPK